MDEVDPKSMNLKSKKVINSPTKIVKTSKNELRSINEVLKYDKRASPIRKSSSNRVKNVVRDLEKAQNKKSNKPLARVKRDMKTEVDKNDDGVLLTQPKIKHFFG